MLSMDEIRQALNMHVLTSVAAQTGINRNTLSQIKNGQEVNPTLKTMQALSDYLAPHHE